MTQDKKNQALDRRGFLRTLGGASSVAVAAVVAPLAADDAQASQSKQERAKARYQESEHVKTFYSVNRY